MKLNIKRVKIVIPNETILNRVNKTPTLKRLSKLELIVGDNIESVNHYQYKEMLRMYPILNITISEI